MERSSERTEAGGPRLPAQGSHLFGMWAPGPCLGYTIYLVIPMPEAQRL